MFTTKRKLISIFSILLSFSLSIQAFAKPTIKNISSNTITNDMPLTIYGSSFGIKKSSQAAPIRFDDFEDGQIGSSVDTSGYWQNEYPGHNPKTNSYAKYDNGSYVDPDFDDKLYSEQAIRPMPLRHSLSNKHIRWHALGTSYPPTAIGKGGNWRKDNVGFAATKKAYINLWVYIDFVAGVGEWSEEWHLKLIFLQSTNAHGSKPFVQNLIWTKNSINSNRNYFSTPTSNLWPAAITEGYWSNIAFQYKDSDINVSNGAVTIYQSRTPLDNTYGKASKVGIVTRNDSINKLVDNVSLGYYITAGALEANTYWDDIYLDNSWARVEVGDNPVYDSCTHREIQIPQTWVEDKDKGDSITVTVKQGSFPFIDKDNNPITYYLFVVDEEGNAGSGYGPITFGAVISSPWYANANRPNEYKQRVDIDWSPYPGAYSYRIDRDGKTIVSNTTKLSYKDTNLTNTTTTYTLYFLGSSGEILGHKNILVPGVPTN